MPKESRIGNFFQLPSAERWFALRALAVVSAVRLGLATLPFRVVHGVVRHRSERALRQARLCAPSERLSTSRVVWAVRAASARVPGSTCLTRALAAQLLLARQGHPSEIGIGVIRGGEDAFAAHAWLTCDGAELGTAERERYTPIATFAIR